MCGLPAKRKNWKVSGNYEVEDILTCIAQHHKHRKFTKNSKNFFQNKKKSLFAKS
jgi:hypothetical protein